MLDCVLVGMVDCEPRWGIKGSFFLAKLIVTVHVVGTFPRNVRDGEVGTAPRAVRDGEVGTFPRAVRDGEVGTFPRAVRDLDAADCGRVVDASLPGLRHRTRRGRVPTRPATSDASWTRPYQTPQLARERRPWNENRHHGIYSEAYTEGSCHDFRFCSMLDCVLVGMVDCEPRWGIKGSFFLAKLIVTVRVVGTFPRNVRGGEVGTAPRAVRDLDAADCGRVVDASLPDAAATG